VTPLLDPMRPTAGSCKVQRNRARGKEQQRHKRQTEMLASGGILADEQLARVASALLVMGIHERFRMGRPGTWATMV
jgi:hypothetical protein